MSENGKRVEVRALMSGIFYRQSGPEAPAYCEVGDQVKATVTEQLVVFVRRPGEPAGRGGWYR